MPSIDNLRFHSSGTEATLMAMRLARAYTGKEKVIKLQDHFHGWHDYAMAGSDRSAPGIPEAIWGSMVIVPAEATFHQHFNMGTERARYLALRAGTGLVERGRRSDLSIEEGGWQIEYPNEVREVHQVFEEELRKRGATCQMKAFVSWCTGEVGPTNEQDT